MSLYDKPRVTVGRESVEPSSEKSVKCWLADPDGRVRPDSVEPNRGKVTHVVWSSGHRRTIGVHDNRTDVVEAVGRGVLFAQSNGAFVDIDRPDRGGWRPMGQREGNGSISASDIAESSHLGRREGSFLKQQASAGINPFRGKHAGIGGEPQITIGQR